MAFSVKNTTAQNLNTLAYNATGINNSAEKISKAMSALVLGVYQYPILNLLSIQEYLDAKTITLDTYVAFQPPIGGNPIVDTPRHIFEVYA